MTISWSELAKFDYWNNIEYLEREWTITEVYNFMDKVDEIINLSQKYKLESVTIQAQEMSAKSLYKLSRFHEAFSLYSKCIDFHENNNNLLKIIEMNNRLGVCLYTIDLEESYRYQYKAFDLLESIDKSVYNIRLRVEVVYCIALYHARKEDFNCAQEYLDSVINLYREDDDLKIKISILKGNILLRQNNHKTALDILEKLINLDKELIAQYEYMIYNNIGVCFYFKTTR